MAGKRPSLRNVEQTDSVAKKKLVCFFQFAEVVNKISVAFLGALLDGRVSLSFHSVPDGQDLSPSTVSLTVKIFTQLGSGLFNGRRSSIFCNCEHSGMFRTFRGRGFFRHSPVYVQPAKEEDMPSPEERTCSFSLFLSATAEAGLAQ